MINDIIELAIDNFGNKRKLGIHLGFPEKYATQRVNKLLKNQNFKLQLFIKIIEAAELTEEIKQIIEKK